MRTLIIISWLVLHPTCASQRARRLDTSNAHAHTQTPRAAHNNKLQEYKSFCTFNKATFMMLKMRMFLGCRFLHNSDGDKCQKVVNSLTKVFRSGQKAKSKLCQHPRRAKPEPCDSVLYGKFIEIKKQMLLLYAYKADNVRHTTRLPRYPATSSKYA